MVVVIMKMNALPEKSLELKQTLLALSEPTRKEKGCLGHNVFQDMENDKNLSIIELWEHWENLEVHLRSANFTVLMGSRSLLSGPPEITVSEEAVNSLGWEAVEAMRR